MEIRIKRPGIPTKIVDCDDNHVSLGRWQLEAADNFDVTTFVPGQVTKQQFSSKMEQTFKVVKGYSMKFTLISTITAKATDYVKMIQKI